VKFYAGDIYEKRGEQRPNLVKIGQKCLEFYTKYPSTPYCYLRNKWPQKRSLPEQWHQALRIAEEVQTLRERATLLRYILSSYKATRPRLKHKMSVHDGLERIWIETVFGGMRVKLLPSCQQDSGTSKNVTEMSGQPVCNNSLIIPTRYSLKLRGRIQP
jgi:hypothetical protein